MTQEIKDLLKPFQMVHLATVEGDQPRLRPMTRILSSLKCKSVACAI
ncbi:MAG TPA: hypothetical protein PKI59_02335 [Candidatus Cloacimonadota bacterium]|jgi:uncharacterized pyridoxamine 5'-phosphate oxidase family protein|nr:hypothetical protein [Candidatus Cloacimonadota bacterium]